MTADLELSGWQGARTQIVRHFLVPGLAGVLAGIAGVAALLGLDVGGLRTLMLGSSDAWIAAPLLCIGFSVTFGLAAIGASVMAIGQD
jgi:hypothetical protein